jgi:hypothetical protein
MTWLRAIAKQYKYRLDGDTLGYCGAHTHTHTHAPCRHKNGSRFVMEATPQEGQPPPIYSCTIKLLLAGLW